MASTFWFVSSLLLTQAAPTSAWEKGVQVHSATCSPDSTGQQFCSVTLGDDPSSHAQGTWQDDIQKTGWGRLLIKTSSSEPGVHAFAAGYLEGYLTAGRVAQEHNNSFWGAQLNEAPAGMTEFLQLADAWWHEQMHAADPKDAYWSASRFISDQLDGLVAGVNAGLGKGQRHFSRFELLRLNSFWDLDDIKKAVSLSHRANFENMSVQALALWNRQHGHCSAVIKLLADGSDLYAGHNTWGPYYNMLRIFKRYEIGSKTPIAMSSYPGMLSSTDDFYQVGDLAVIETTLPNYNNDIYELIKPETLLWWVRAMTANQLATSGPDWMDIFQKHNSGTYNNMWMVVDYSKFTPREPLREGLLTVGEQSPGYFHYEDQTMVLSYGYWPSYNAALYPETARRIKQDVMERTKGTRFSYQLVERAQIFRRDQSSITSDEGMQRLMRYNQFQTDPIAHGDSCSQIACRGDLAAEPSMRAAFGAIDAKYTSATLNRMGKAVIVSGPSHDDQAVFDWSVSKDLAASTPHAGQPSRFNFGWQVVGPDLSIASWSSEDLTTQSETRLAVVFAVVVLVILVVGVSVAAFRRCRRVLKRRLVPDAHKHNMDRSPLLSATSTAYPSTVPGAWPLPSPAPAFTFREDSN